MTKYMSRLVIALYALGLAALTVSNAAADTACFTSSRNYRIHPLHGGSETRDGWTVRGDQFGQCVRRAEAADKSLHARYPDTIYALSLASTIGCHSPCG